MLYSLLLATFSLGALGKIESLERTQTHGEYWKMWTQFLEYRHGGKHKSQEDHDHRFGVFMDNVDKITRHNVAGHSWKMGVTKFADMTADEFGAFVKESNCERYFAAEQAQRKANQLMSELRGEVAEAIAPLNNPASVDWSKKGVVTAVKNQGQCGSCWAFSVTGAVESRYAIAKGKLNSLSEQELVDCDNQSDGCGGGWMTNGLEFVVQNGGLCLESDYSYHARNGNCQKSSCTPVDPISSYKHVEQSSSAMETAVAAGPVSIAIEADQDAFQLYTEGVLTGNCGTRTDHGVLVVGYGTDGGKNYWKVKNSWGQNWGEDGYIRMCKDCDANNGGGQCGILTSGNYPVV